MGSMKRLLMAACLMTLPGASWASPELTLPETSMGSSPYKSFSGELCDTPTDVFTVPEGQEFLVTMVVTTTDGGSSHHGDWTDNYGAMLLNDGVVLLAGIAIGQKSTIPVASGFGKLPVRAGSTLSIKSLNTAGCSHHFYLQGRLIKEGSPYRSFYGNSASGMDILTVETGKQFIVRTIALSSREWPNHCHVWVDGVRTLHGNTWATTDRSHWGSGRPGGFAIGMGALVLNEGSTLRVGSETPELESQCDYYIAGEYMNP